ncbi:MAG: diacylglycerol kinase, partial [Chitinophagaceae bacterium]
MLRKFIYFINPISGTKNKEALLQLIKDKTVAQGIAYDILHTRADGDYSFLEQKIKEEAITDIIICGGDGTVNQVSAALQGINVSVGIIPMGSGNGLALTAGIPVDPSKALDLIFTGKTGFIDGFYINNNFSCMLCGLGFDAQVAHDFAAQKKRGLITYVQQTLKNFFSAKPYPFTIHIDGQHIKTDAFFISIANSNQFGNNVTIAPKASIS